MSASLLSGKVFLLVTGASKGIGRQIAESFGSLLGEGSLVLLLARNSNGLKETANKLPKRIKVQTRSVDLRVTDANHLKDIISKAVGPAGVTQFENAIIVHNAASIGDLSKPTIALTDFQTWRDYYDLNVFSPAVLNGVFMQLFNEASKVTRFVINVTSIAANTPFGSAGYYCSGKAARTMFFKVFATENPNVYVLNYSPGFVDTDMLHAVITGITDPSARNFFREVQSSDLVLTTQQTVNRMIEIIKLQKFNSGDIIDYSDLLEA
ncbi:sepiapterin reductase-like [Neodiprion lecontei]|uniref:Sepiapterin reductase n=1 Tax=Neodiprion lecontei TaxID=441921 RepID=A0A6J0BVR4_NEOLC|nr:sepiapterin reductase-like [Neodiprion lecontei]